VCLLQDLLRELADILASSDGSLAGAAAVPATPAHSQGWWDARIALDARLAALQGRLDASLLGPWRCKSTIHIRPRSTCCLPLPAMDEITHALRMHQMDQCT
jgi:Peptidase family C50